ncbi:hypothetical protein MML48_4g00002721 [Holotrichia oblita]|uniref:Uncharacterized protein n=1 Tax=Holotrichia oblita TaxID=644536 RepID=A0ACB9T6E5_HOLOL|nr:hypothetical protein MML48_4g00002721 [Holotrichia oblita]
MKARGTSGNMVPAETNNDNNQEDQDPAIPCTTLSNNNNEDQTNIPNRRPKKATQNITSYESTLLRILQQKQNEEISEDKQFALMLVPMLQNLNDDHKHYAKVEILNVMSYAKNYYRPVPVVPYPGAHCSNIVPPPSFTQAANFQTLSQCPTTNFQSQPLQTISQPPLTHNQISECSASNYYSQFSENLLSPNSSRDYSVASSPALSENNSELFDMSNQ